MGISLFQEKFPCETQPIPTKYHEKKTEIFFANVLSWVIPSKLGVPKVSTSSRWS
jgi:hypothetical protein